MTDADPQKIAEELTGVIHSAEPALSEDEIETLYDAVSLIEGQSEVVNVHAGASIKAKVKRGTDTRDQDEIVIKGKGADADEAGYEFETALDHAEREGWTQRLRDLQPDGEDN